MELGRDSKQPRGFDSQDARVLRLAAALSGTCPKMYFWPRAASKHRRRRTHADYDPGLGPGRNRPGDNRCASHELPPFDTRGVGSRPPCRASRSRPCGDSLALRTRRRSWQELHPFNFNLVCVEREDPVAHQSQRSSERSGPATPPPTHGGGASAAASLNPDPKIIHSRRIGAI